MLEGFISTPSSACSPTQRARKRTHARGRKENNRRPQFPRRDASVYSPRTSTKSMTRRPDDPRARPGGDDPQTVQLELCQIQSHSRSTAGFLAPTDKAENQNDPLSGRCPIHKLTICHAHWRGSITAQPTTDTRVALDCFHLGQRCATALQCFQSRGHYKLRRNRANTVARLRAHLPMLPTHTIGRFFKASAICRGIFRVVRRHHRSLGYAPFGTRHNTSPVTKHVS